MSPRPIDAAPDHGSGVSPYPVLVIGYGNTLRRDDGVGVHAAELLAADPRLSGSDVEVKVAYQLLPEMAFDMGACALVVFVDADVRGLPGSIAVNEIEPESAARSDADARAEPGASTHHVGGGELVALAGELTGSRPRALQVGIGVVDLELGEGLSPAVEAALPRVVEVVAGLIDEHRAARVSD